ncbi:6425_t:CDS:1 [Paraglomus brasilianum]|uniref:6425_t:CDS:1 n=1 Tax=Paraglomus brasilianum TaxID=144538 RepID=A0A9N8WH98_9GLOM|nr:6425_t:CDS:1 [Paraglomus brasilianum]
MPRPNTLASDLKLVINDPRYSDIKIKCSDGELHASRIILAARCRYFNQMIYAPEDTNQNSEINSFIRRFSEGIKVDDSEIVLGELTTAAMKIVLEFIYTDSIEKDSVTVDTLVDIFYAAYYVGLDELQKTIISIAKKRIRNKSMNDLALLLSKAVATLGSSRTNMLYDLLLEHLGKKSLDQITYSNITVDALLVLMKVTGGNAKFTFVTSEYALLRYVILHTAARTSDSIFELLRSRLPTQAALKKLDDSEKQRVVEGVSLEIQDLQKVNDQIQQFIPLIDLRRIEVSVVASYIEPLGIISADVINQLYRYYALGNIPLPQMRDGMILQWDPKHCGDGLDIAEDGCVVVTAPNTKTRPSIRANKLFYGSEVYEWDIIVEQPCNYVWIGVVSAECVDFNGFFGTSAHGWAIGSNGYKCTNNEYNRYGQPFGKGAIVTVHLDLNNKKISFTINGYDYSAAYYTLPGRLYPAVSIDHPGQLRIRPHKIKSKK